MLSDGVALAARPFHLELAHIGFRQDHPRQERRDELKQSIESSLPRLTQYLFIGRKLGRRHIADKPQEADQRHS